MPKKSHSSPVIKSKRLKNKAEVGQKKAKNKAKNKAKMP